MLSECLACSISAAYKKSRFRGALQAPRCASRRAPKGAVDERIHRGAGSGASTDVLREIADVCVLRPYPWAPDVTRNVGACVTRDDQPDAREGQGARAG